MNANPFLGVCLPLAGRAGLGQFLRPVPLRPQMVLGGLLAGGRILLAGSSHLGFSASLKTNDLLTVLGSAPASSLGWAYFWGAMWGLGGLTFGLTMRYLGMSLGMAVALGLLRGVRDADAAHLSRRLHAQGPRHHLRAGDSDRRGHLPAGHRRRRHGGHVQGTRDVREQKKATIKEFNFVKGILVATFSGRDERQLRLRPGCGRPHRRPLRASTARPSFGPACPSCAWCCWAGSRRISFGVPT